MPVALDTKKDSSHPHELICDVCGINVGWADNDWASYSGYGREDPKFAIYCPEHWKLIYMPYILGRHHETIERKPIVSTEEIKPVEAVEKGLVKNNEIQWDNIDILIGKGECKVSTLAEELNVPINDLRKAMIDHYGDKIEFRRGRTGGVFWKKGQ